MYRFLLVLIFGAAACLAKGQVNVDQVIRIGQNTMWLEDYVLSIQYFMTSFSMPRSTML